MAISYQQTAGTRDTGSQGLMQLGQALQQHSQFESQLAEAKTQFEAKQAQEAEQFKMSYDQTQQQMATQKEQNLIAYEQKKKELEAEAANTLIEQGLEERKVGVAETNAAVNVKEANIAQETADSTDLKRKEDIRIDEEQLDLGWAKLGIDPSKNKGLSLEEAARHKATMDGYLSEIKTLTSELTVDGKEKNKKTYDKDLAKAEFKRVAYNKLADTYGTDKLKEMTDTEIEVSHAGFFNDYNIKNVEFEGKITPYSGKETDTGKTDGESTTSYMRNGTPVSETEYTSARNAYMRNPNDPAVKAAFTSIQKQTK